MSVRKYGVEAFATQRCLSRLEPGALKDLS